MSSGTGPPPPPAALSSPPGSAPRPPGESIYTWKFPFPPSPPPALAGALAKAMAFLVVALALTGLGFAFSSPLAAIAGMVALGVGIAVGHTLPVDDLFTRVSGWVVALAAGTVYLVIAAFIGAITHNLPPLEPAPYLGLVIVGLDWKRADRLRPSVFLSGLFLIPLIGIKSPASLVIALIWLGAALATLWVLQADTERGQRRAVPVHSSTAAGGELPLRGTDLLRILGSAALISMALALLIGNPSCDSRARRSPFSSATGDAYDPSDPRIDPNLPYDPNSPVYDPSDPRDPRSPNYDPNDPSSYGQGGGAGGAGGRGATGGRGASGNGQYGNGNGQYGNGQYGNGQYGNGNGSGGYGNRGGGSGSAGSGAESGSESESGSGRAVRPGTPLASAEDSTDLTVLLYILLGIGVLIAAVAIAVMMFNKIRDDEDDEDLEEHGHGWFGRRRKPTHREWARAALARLVKEGERRGRPRRKAETIARYCAALRATVLPDERLLGVAQVLDDALYGPREITAEEIAWVEGVLDDIASMPTDAERESESVGS